MSRENRWSNNGFFTQYLIKGLKGAADSNADRIITAKEIYTYVSAKVAESRVQRESLLSLCRGEKTTVAKKLM